MAASDIPPSPFTLRVPGLKGDQAANGFNVQSFAWSIEVRGSDKPSPTMQLTRLVDGASPTISGAFALRKTVAPDITVAVVDASSSDVLAYLLTDPRVVHYEIAAAVGGNERATETVVLASNHMTVTSAQNKRSIVI
jgi:hypothetical protein